MRSHREALHQLDTLVLMAEPTTATLGPFMAEHVALMTSALGLTDHEVLALGTLPDEPLVFYLGPALRQYWARQKDAAMARKTEQLRSASQQLVDRVNWRGDRAELDAGTLLGPLLASTAKVLLFTSSAWEVGIARSKLRELNRALGHRDDLTAFVDGRGLHVHWRQGKGRLVLYPQPRAHSGQDMLVVSLGGADATRTIATAAE